MNVKLAKTLRRACKHHPKNPRKYRAAGDKNRYTGKINDWTGKLFDCTRATYQSLKRNYKNGVEL